MTFSGVARGDPHPPIWVWDSGGEAMRLNLHIGVVPVEVSVGFRTLRGQASPRYVYVLHITNLWITPPKIFVGHTHPPPNVFSRHG